MIDKFMSMMIGIMFVFTTIMFCYGIYTNAITFEIPMQFGIFTTYLLIGCILSNIYIACSLVEIIVQKLKHKKAEKESEVGYIVGSSFVIAFLWPFIMPAFVTCSLAELYLERKYGKEE